MISAQKISDRTPRISALARPLGAARAIAGLAKGVERAGADVAIDDADAADGQRPEAGPGRIVGRSHWLVPPLPWSPTAHEP